MISVDLCNHKFLYALSAIFIIFSGLFFNEHNIYFTIH